MAFWFIIHCGITAQKTSNTCPISLKTYIIVLLYFAHTRHMILCKWILVQNKTVNKLVKHGTSTKLQIFSVVSNATCYLWTTGRFISKQNFKSSIHVNKIFNSDFLNLSSITMAKLGRMLVFLLCGSQMS